MADALQSAYADAPFVRLTGATLPEIKHVAHTNFCDIGWKVDEQGSRAVLVAVLDNLVKGAAGLGGAEPEHHARHRRAHGPAVMARAMRIVLKLGGELLERPEDVARVAKAIATSVARRAALVVVHGGGKEIDAALAVGGHPEAAGGRPARHRRGDARRGRVGAGGGDQYAAGRRGPARGREAGGADRRGRDGGDRQTGRAGQDGRGRRRRSRPGRRAGRRTAGRSCCRICCRADTCRSSPASARRAMAG